MSETLDRQLNVLLLISATNQYQSTIDVVHIVAHAAARECRNERASMENETFRFFNAKLRLVSAALTEGPIDFL